MNRDNLNQPYARSMQGCNNNKFERQSFALSLDVNRFKVLIIEYKQSLNCLDNNVMGAIILHP